MKKLSVLLFVVAVCSCTAENRFVPSDRVPYPEATKFLAVDLVKSRRDPKGGWFGPTLLDVYLRDNTKAGDNTPEEFCGNAPHIPTGEEITVFFTYKEGTSEGSSCRLIVAVAKGEAVWNTKTGKPINEKEIESLIQGIPQSYSMAQNTPVQPTQPVSQDIPSVSGKSSGLVGGTSFTAVGADGKYVFIWGHALHELTDPPAYSLGKFDTNDDPDAEIQTMHLDTYLLRRALSEQKGIFTFEVGEYEAMKPEQKATVQGFCKERIRILEKEWPDVNEQSWKQGGWYELDAPRPNGNLRPICK